MTHAAAGAAWKWTRTAAWWQALTLVHFSAQHKHFLWDPLGTFSR